MAPKGCSVRLCYTRLKTFCMFGSRFVPDIIVLVKFCIFRPMVESSPSTLLLQLLAHEDVEISQAAKMLPASERQRLTRLMDQASFEDAPAAASARAGSRGSVAKRAQPILGIMASECNGHRFMDQNFIPGDFLASAK